MVEPFPKFPFMSLIAIAPVDEASPEGKSITTEQARGGLVGLHGDIAKAMKMPKCRRFV
jgi:hypothetical protein